jgi:hypothetical protein
MASRITRSVPVTVNVGLTRVDGLIMTRLCGQRPEEPAPS